jgi:dihydrofolate synthase/folylpolyglutamate synthase
VHVYTTPHLIEFNERIMLAGAEISDDFLREACETVRVAADAGNIKLGFYEATTAAAFWAFSRMPADYLLLETGMGGRLDATNIIPAPLLTIITTISLDHTKFLGETIGEIAWEKAQIIKRGTKVISSMQHNSAHEVIEGKCAEVGADLICFGADFNVEASSDGMIFECRGELMEENLQFSEPCLYGEHQFVNSASAIAAAMVLEISKNSMEVGLKTARINSRMELITNAKKPFVPQDWEFWLDGGHNAGAAYALANLILDKWTDSKPTYLVFGTTRGRDVADFVGKFKGVVEHVALVKINFEPNSYDEHELFAQVDVEEKSAHQSIQDAVAFLHKHNPAAARVLCCGSLFMRGDIY